MLRRLWYFLTCDRIGPDIPLTHFLLHYHPWGAWLCRKKFRSIGQNVQFRPGAFAIYTSQITIGSNVVIRPGTMLFADDMGGDITIGDDVAIGAGVHIYTNNHRFDDRTVPIKYQGYYPSKPVVLKRGCWIGGNAVILLGVTVGENAVVGAGAVVSQDVEPHSMVVGNPARPVKRMTEPEAPAVNTATDITTKARAVFMSVFGVDPLDIKDASQLTVPGWDSMQHFNLIAALEAAFGVGLNENQVVRMVTFRDIVATLEEAVGLHVSA